MKVHRYRNREAVAAAFEDLGYGASADAVRGSRLHRPYRSLPGAGPGNGGRALDDVVSHVDDTARMRGWDDAA